MNNVFPINFGWPLKVFTPPYYKSRLENHIKLYFLSSSSEAVSPEGKVSMMTLQSRPRFRTSSMLDPAMLTADCLRKTCPDPDLMI